LICLRIIKILLSGDKKIKVTTTKIIQFEIIFKAGLNGYKNQLYKAFKDIIESIIFENK